MRRLTRGTIREARNILTLTRARGSGSGGGVAIPQPTAQNEIIIADATPAWSLLAAPSAQGQALIAGADPYTPVWSYDFTGGANFIRDAAATTALTAYVTGDSYTRFTVLAGGDLKWGSGAGAHDVTLYRTGINMLKLLGTLSVDTGIILSGASGYNALTIPDNAAIGMHIVDAGVTEYLRIITTDAQPVVVFNEGSTDVDFRVEASGEENALFVQGSDGFIALGHSDPERMLHLKSDTVNKANIILAEYTSSANGPDVLQRKARGTIASPSDVAVDDSLGAWYFAGYRNADWRRGAAVKARTTSLGTSVVRGQLVFQTANASGTLVDYLRVDEDGDVDVYENSAWARLSGTFALHFVIAEPTVETVGQIRIPWACTVTRVDANTLGGTSCTFNIEERGTLGSAGTNVLSSDMAAAASGESVTSSFNNSSLAAGNYLAYDVSAVSGAVDYVSITLTGTID